MALLLEDSTVSQSEELQTILADLIDANASTPALVGVLSAIPATLKEKQLVDVANAVRNVLRFPPAASNSVSP